MFQRVPASEECPATHSLLSLVAQVVKSLPAMQETMVQSLGQELTLENGMATLSRILTWEIPWTEKPAWWDIVHEFAERQTQLQ